MRTAVISDVHGNRFALEAVLADLQAERPDLIANLGDQVHGASDPAGAYALQAELGAVEVRGNNEEKLGGLGPVGPRQDRYTDWVRSVVGEPAADRLAALPLVAQLAGGDVLAAHASPQHAWSALFEVWRGDRLDRLATPDEMLQRVAGYPRARVVVVGHSHRERLAVTGGVTFVNVGPVSWPVDGVPSARWALLERRRDLWSVEFRRVPYDVEAAVAWAARHGPGFSNEEVLLRGGAPAGRRA